MKNDEISKGTDLNQVTDKGNLYTEGQGTKHEDKKEDFMRHAHTADEEKTTNPDGTIRQTRASYRENTNVSKTYSNFGAPLEKKAEFAQLPMVLGWIGIALTFFMNVWLGTSSWGSAAGAAAFVAIIRLRKRMDTTWLKIFLWTMIISGVIVAVMTSIAGGVLIALTGILYMVSPKMKRI